MKKKVLFVTELYQPGCLEPTLLDLISGLDPARCEVHLIMKASADRAAYLKGALPRHVTVHEPKLLAVQERQDALAASPGSSLAKLPLKLWLRLLRDVYFILDISLLREQVFELKPDVVEAVNGGYPGGLVCLAAVVAARSLGVKSIGLTALRDPQARRFCDFWLDDLIARSADRINSSSCMSTEAFAARRAMPAEKLRTVHIGLAPEAPSSSKQGGGIVAGYANYFNDEKGHRFLLEAAKALADKYPNLRWVCSGHGPALEKTKALAKRLGLDAVVSFPGFMKESESVAGVDLVVHPSLQENFPTVILEAMRAGKPIVAARVGGIPEQLEDGKSGLLVVPGDAKALEAAVARLLCDPALSARLGAGARERFLAEFTVEAMRRRFFETALL